MPRPAASFVVVSALCVLATAAADAPYRDYGDRMEGVPARDRSGAFHLFGVHVRPSVFRGAMPKLYLTIPLAAETELDVKVWEDDKGYQMVPHQKSFTPSGTFSWPRAAVLEQLRIDPRRLGVLAIDPRQRVYYPALLESEPPSAPVDGYAFVYFSPAGIELTVEIAREEGDGTLTTLSTFKRVEDFGGYLHFHWDGRDASGKPAASGIYRLRLEGRGFGNPSFPIKTDVRFMHFERR